MPSRRRFLGLAAGVAVAGTAGCAAEAPLGEEAAIVPRQEPLEMGDHVRATADAITTNWSSTDSDYTYIPENHSVRYPATMSGGEVASYRTIPFEEWARVECAEAGTIAMREHLDATLPADRFRDTGIGKHDDVPLHIGVFHNTVMDEHGDVVYEPPVSAQELANRTPRSVTATIDFARQTATNTVPVYVQKTGWDCGAPNDVSCPEPAE